MRARLIVFPIRGRIWCFSRSSEPSVSASATSSQTPSTLKDLWKNISMSDKPLNANAEILADFVANKMNKAWLGLEKAPDGSLKNKAHGLGLRLLSRVKPSEIFLKSITKEVTGVEVIYPSSLDARLVRRRLRHMAMRGTIIHKQYLYGSISLLPLTSALAGSEKLFQLVSDTSVTSTTNKKNESEQKDSRNESHNSHGPYWVLQPSKELEHLLHDKDGENNNGLSQSAIKKICKIYDLNTIDVMKYKRLD